MTDNLSRLVNNFNTNLEYYKSSEYSYNETDTRREYIDPLFKQLGWDLENEKGVKPELREVMAENYLSEENNQRPDYLFNLTGVCKFFAEAKKPAIDITKDKNSIFQAKSYGWSGKHSIVVLTNFEYLLIYDTRFPPKPDDSPDKGLLESFHYKDYLKKDKWDKLYSLLSREVIYSGKFEETFKPLLQEGPQLPVNEYFLDQINEWRLKLANCLYKTLSGTSIDYINDLTQNFINQIVFLRICEDRNLPIYHKLNKTIESEENVKKGLENIFKAADKKYNSGLFCGEHIVFDLNNEIIMSIIKDLYYPQSPYTFSVIEANILGEIYELFLSKHLIVSDTNEIILTEKQEHIGRDVVTTPIEIVRYMVNKTLEPLCKEKSPKEILDLRIADIACGSGVFLVEIFEYLIRYLINWYKENNYDHLVIIDNNQLTLPLEEKKALLSSCIFGIDIDHNAVEVAKFSLFIKLIEHETYPTLSHQNEILPDLEQNIIQGNSLVEFSHTKRKRLSNDELEAISPFDWNFVNEEVTSFDAVICNPPYVTTEDIKNLLPEKEIKIYKSYYQSAYRQYDKYFLFVERALNKLNSGGRMCFIIPNKFSKIASGEKLRALLTKNNYVSEFIDFGSEQLFKKKGKTIYSSILVADKGSNDKFVFENVSDYQKWWAEKNNDPNESTGILLNSEILSEKPWVLVSDKEEANLINTLYDEATYLNNYFNIDNGIQTSAERPIPIYWFSTDEILNETDNIIEVKRNGINYKIEKSLLKPFFKPVKPSEKNLNSYDFATTNKYIIFPYDKYGRLYDKKTMESKFPYAWKYLSDNYDRLLPRQVTGNNTDRDVSYGSADTWYRYGREQHLKSFINKPKLIVGILTKNPLYIYDESDMLIASGGTAGYCAISKKEHSPYKLEYIQAVLNHPVTEWLCSIIGSDFDNNYYSRGTFVLKRIPVKKIDLTKYDVFKMYNDIIKNTQRIYSINKTLKQDLNKRKKNSLIREKYHLITEIMDIVTKLYNIEDYIETIRKIRVRI